MNDTRDSFFSWLVLFSVLCSQIVHGGICFSGGLFYAMFTDALGSNPVMTSWVCSMPTTMWFLSSPLASIIISRYGYRTCAFLGGFITTIGLVLSYLATGINFLFLSHGLITGLGLGFNYNGCIAALNVYFDRYKTLATGITSAGHNVGLIIFAELLFLLDEGFGWRGVILLLAAVAFHQCACACLMFPVKMQEDDKAGRIKHLQKPKKKYCNLLLFSQLSFVLFCISSFLLSFAQGIYILYLPSFAIGAGFTHEDFGMVLTTYSITNLTGKVIFSILGQYRELAAYSLSLALTGVSIGLSPLFMTRTGTLVLAAVAGFFFCVTGALVHAVIYKITGFSKFAYGVGLSMPFKAFGNLLGGPTGGVMLSMSGSFSSAFFLAGATMVSSAVLMVQPFLHDRHDEIRRKRSGIYAVSEINVLTNRGLLQDPRHTEDTNISSADKQNKVNNNDNNTVLNESITTVVENNDELVDYLLCEDTRTVHSVK